MSTTFASQADYDIRFEWGRAGAMALEAAHAIVVVDVLSFTTCVEIVVAQRGEVYPFRHKDNRAEEFASSNGAQLARPRSELNGFSLSPASLLRCGPIQLVLPSPNGSEITSSLASDVPVFAACLRNARAVAGALKRFDSVNIVAAGERWLDGSLRVAIEDLIGAGAVIARLDGSKSPEAQVAEQTFHACASSIHVLMQECSSGRELIERGFERDVLLAAEYNVSEAIPILRDGKFVSGAT